jgi:archaellum component FlaC
LIGSLVTGLPDLEPVTGQELNVTQRNRIRLRRQSLAGDHQLRSFLLDISRNRQMDVKLRQHAWRTLLGCLPPDREGHITREIALFGGDLFDVTLDVATECRQRSVVPVLLASWPQLVAGKPTDRARRDLLVRVCQLAGLLRHRGFVERPDGQPAAPLIGLALDEANEQVRDAALAAIQAAGFTAELDRERERRRIDELVVTLGKVENAMIELEVKQHGIGQDTVKCQGESTGIGLRLQEEVQARSFLVTDGWLETSRVQVELQQVQVELTEALARAEERHEMLRDLSRQMRSALADSEQAYEATHALVAQQEAAERRQEALQARSRAVQGTLEAARRELRQMRNPDPPGPRESAEESCRVQRDYQRELQRIAADRSRLEGRIGEAEAEIESLNGQRRDVEEVVRRLAAEIRRESAQHGALSGRLESLDRDFRGVRAELARLRNTIDQLTNRVAQLRRDQQEAARVRERKREESDRTVETSANALGRLEKRLESLARDYSQTSGEIERCHTQVQRCVADIEVGRQNHVELGKLAEVEIPNADRTGNVDQHQLEDGVQEAQDSLLWYAVDVQRAVRAEPKRAERGHQQEAAPRWRAAQ